MNYTFDRATGCLLDLEPSVPLDRPAPQRQRARPGDPPQGAHDAAHGPAHLWARIPCAWKIERFADIGPLTDAAIAKRQRQGYFGGVKAAMA